MVRRELGHAGKSRFFGRVLLSIDLSRETPKVLRYGSHLAEIFGSEVVVCYVAPLATSVPGNEADGLLSNPLERKILHSLEDLVARKFEASRTKIKILHGDPADRIVEFADFASCDLIIIGSKGKGVLKRALLGSVSGSVAAKSKKPVLILK